MENQKTKSVIKRSIYPFSSMILSKRRERYFVETFTRRELIDTHQFKTLFEAQNYFDNFQFRIALKIYELVESLFIEEAKGGQ